MTPSDLAGLAQVVLSLSAGGDATAKALVEQSVKELAWQVDTAIRKLALEKPPLALAGSQLRGEVRRGLVTAITSPIGEVAYVEDPCRGAVTLAKRHFKAQARYDRRLEERRPHCSQPHSPGCWPRRAPRSR